MCAFALLHVLCDISDFSGSDLNLILHNSVYVTHCFSGLLQEGGTKQQRAQRGTSPTGTQTVK